VTDNSWTYENATNNW